ncbi:MAG: patatin-like phospholipase family protein [Anaerolineaceae bacterium]
MTARRIGLALGGGGARALAHIGVLKVLVQAEIPIHLISGTSMGAILAAAYAVGYSPQEMEARALEFSSMRSMMRLVDIHPPRRGLMQGNRVRSYLANLLGEQRRIEDLRFPLGLNAVDLISAQEIIFTRGPLLPAVLASMSVPGLFAPVEMDGYRLVDGGVLNNVPVNIARQLGADVVIAVDVENALQRSTAAPDARPPVPMPDLFNQFYHLIMVITVEATRQRLKESPPDLFILPPIPREIDVYRGFPRAREAIAAGEQAAREALPAIQTLIRGD